jgi:hypothetical protein
MNAASEPAPVFRLASRETALVTLASTALVLVFLAPMLAAWGRWGIEDWDQHAFYHEAARLSLLEYGQIPLWNPYYCGGTDLLANPQSRFLSPTFPILLFLGTAAGLKVELALYAILGVVGAYALGRDQGLDRIAAWLPPSAYFLSTLYALPASTGMTWCTSTAYLPWAFFFHLRASRHYDYALACGGCLALMFFAGGAYLLVVSLSFLVLYTLFGWREPGLRRGSKALTLAVLSCLAFGAVKILPAGALMAEFPRRMAPHPGFSLQSLWVGLFDEDQGPLASARFDGPHFDSLLRGISTDFDDVGMYVGSLVGAFFVAGAAVGLRRHWKLVAAVLCFGALSFGDRLPLSPFDLLHRLPIFVSMRYPERFRFVWLLCGLLLAGHGLQWFRGRVGRFLPDPRWGTLASAVLVACLLLDFRARVWPVYRAAFPIPAMEFARGAEFRQISRLPNYDATGLVGTETRVFGSWSAHMPALLMNRGAVDCYETAFVPRRAIPMTDPGYHGEAYLSGTTGILTTELWTPNRLRYAVQVDRAARLVVNQNYYRGWKSIDGRPVLDQDGLLSVRVAPEDDVVEIYYRPRGFVVGAAISVAAWASWILSWWPKTKPSPASIC